MEDVITALDSSLSHIKWRLKALSKRRLEIDILALCTGMRPVVMIDYGGKMPELQDRLCALLDHIQKEEGSIFEHLRVMVIDDMIYLIHVKELAKYARLSLNPQTELHFVDLEEDPPKMMTKEENGSLGMQLVSIQKTFSLVFPHDEMKNDNVPHDRVDHTISNSSSEPTTLPSSEIIDLSYCMQDTDVTVPTLNGWLLGYPVIYLFGKDHIEDAIYNLSTKSLRIYQILISRHATPNKASRQPEELMSFSVPYDLSMGGSEEPWAVKFLAFMQSNWEKSKQTWLSLRMEVGECYPQAIVL